MELTHIANRSGRLSSFLREEMALSAGLMNRLKWKEKLLVNGVPVHTDYGVVPGDEIRVLLEEPRVEYPAEDLPVTVLYEDSHILCVDKPSGMLIHPSRSCLTGTLANRVIGYYQKTGQESAFHPITRLDRDTFGVVLLAKNAHIHALLNQAHQQGKLTKIYHALTYGGPAEDFGVMDAPIARMPLPSLLREVHPLGKESVTRFQVLCRQPRTCQMRLQPITGRTHQLRVHCAHYGFPIVGDPQYATEESRDFSRQQAITTQRLCAKRVEFIHPVTGRMLAVESKMDAFG